MSNPPLHLPAPSSSTLARQTAVGIAGSPVALSRTTSTSSGHSDILLPDDSIRRRLVVYRTYLEHELDFVDNEIQALIQRPASQDISEETAFQELRNGLKIRFNSLSLKLTRVNDLLAVL